MIDILLFGVGLALFWGLGMVLARYWPTRTTKVLPPSECAHEYCASRVDVRCAGENCTQHCQSVLGCEGACIRVWERNVKHADDALDIARQALAKARK